MKISWQFFGLPFNDERWIGKAVVGGLLGLFGIIIWPLLLPLMGYAMRVLRQTSQGNAPTLPDWRGWGGLLKDGLRFVVVGLIYNLPGPLLSVCATLLVLYAPEVISSTTLPSEFEVVGILAYLAVIGFGTVLSLPLAFLALVAATRMIVHDSLRSAFEFGKVLCLARAGIGNFLLSFAIFYGVWFFAYSLAYLVLFTIILACLMPFLLGLAIFYSVIMMGALFGTAYYETQSELAVAGELVA